MTVITIPDIGSVASCRWADNLDAAALRGFARTIRTIAERSAVDLPYGSDTTRMDPNGVRHPSTFGTELRLADVGTVKVSLGRTREYQTDTDDLKVSLTRPDAPPISFEMRVPIVGYVERPDRITAQTIASGLLRLSRRIGGSKPVREAPSAVSNTSIVESVASLLAFRQDLAGRAKIAIDMTACGPVVMNVVVPDSDEMTLDDDTMAALGRRMRPTFDLLLSAQGGDLGKRWAAHDCRIRVKVPLQAPDPVTTMRLLVDLGLTDMPDVA